MKATITIDDKKYHLPMSYKDVKLSRFKLIQKFINSDTIVTPFLLKEKEDIETPTEEQLINYYVRFINVATDIPVNTLMKVNLTTTYDNIGIRELFDSLTWLFVMPQETTGPLKKIGNYHFFDVSGIMKDNTLVEYTEASTLTASLNNLKEANLDYLNLLLGIFYRPKVGFIKRIIEPYNSDSVQQRAKEFDDLTMDIVWNALFFFTQSKRESLKNIGGSLEEKLKEAQRVKHSSNIIGSFSNVILLKVAYLIRRIKLRMNRLILRMFTTY